MPEKFCLAPCNIMSGRKVTRNTMTCCHDPKTDWNCTHSSTKKEKEAVFMYDKETYKNSLDFVKKQYNTSHSVLCSLFGNKMGTRMQGVPDKYPFR